MKSIEEQYRDYKEAREIFKIIGVNWEDYLGQKVMRIARYMKYA